MMDIAIPTRGRANMQTSLQCLIEAKVPVTLVTHRSEYDAGLYSRYAGIPGVSVVAPDVEGIAHVRQWIIDSLGTSDNVCMVDDDLTFYKRSIVDPTKLVDLPPAELKDAFNRLAALLDDRVAHTGFASREGANRCTDPLLHNTRILRVLAYHRPDLHAAKVTFGRVPVMEDFDVALQLLQAGYGNAVLNDIAHNQRGSGTTGGCSIYRDMKLQGAAAEAMAALYPKYVKVVEKTTKGAWGGGTRKDVTIQWKKAYAQPNI